MIEKGLVTDREAWRLSLGEFSYIGRDCELLLPHPQAVISIGKYTVIESGVKCAALSIGNFCVIGKNCVLGRNAVVNDACVLLPGSELPANARCAPATVWGGRPAKLLRTAPVGRFLETTALAHTKCIDAITGAM